MLKENAQLNVGGSVNIATADNLRFTNVATLFDAAATPASLGPLHIASVAAFGFTSPRPVAISIEGSTLQVASSQGLSMIGGDFTMTGGTLRAPGGLIQIASVASPGEVITGSPGQAAELGVNSFIAMAPVNLSGGAQIDTSGNGGGTVLIRGSQVTLNNGGTVNAGTTGSGSGGAISITAAESITLSGRSATGVQSQILSSTSSGGNAGQVTLAAPTLTLDDALVRARADTGSSGQGGTITTNAGTLSLTNGASMSTSTLGTGGAGTVAVITDVMSVATGSTITSGTNSQGAGGTVALTATESIMIAGRNAAGTQSQVTSNALSSGNGGQVVISAPMLTLSDALLQATNGTGSTGRAGTLTVNAGTLNVTNGASLSTSTFGAGAAGAMNITATNGVTVAGRNTAGTRSGFFSTTSGGGNAGQVVISAPMLTLSDALLQANARTGSTGRAGAITANVDTLNVMNGAQINTSTSGKGAGGTVSLAGTNAVTIAGRNAGGTQSQVLSNTSGNGNGAAGHINISAPTVTLDDALVRARPDTTGSTGQGGTVTITGGDVMIQNGAGISTSTFGSGKAGTVSVTGTDMVKIAGRNTADTQSGLFSDTSGSGQAGQVAVSAPSITLTDALVRARANTGGTGPAGTITINADTVSVVNGTEISTSTFGPGAAGTVNVTATNAVTVSGRDAAGTQGGLFSNTSGSGNAGQVNVWAPTIIADDVLVRARANTGSTGAGGTVMLTGDDVTLRNGTAISASTFGAGAGGTVRVTGESLTLDAAEIFATSEESSTGAGGTVILTGDDVTLRNDALISLTTFSAGDAGTVGVDAQTLTLDASSIFSRSGTGSTGPGGTITITADDVTLRNGSQIKLSTSGAGAAGTVRVNAQTLTFDDSFIIARSEEGSTGTGGTIMLTGGDVTLQNSTDISASSEGTGRAGAVQVEAQTLTLDFASISTFSETGSTGPGGTIAITAGDVTLRNLALIGADTFGAAGGGTVQVDARTLTLDASDISTNSATGSTGPGGTIAITADDVVLRNDAGISASTSGTGRGGNITVTADGSLAMTDDSTLSSRTFGSGDGGRIALTAPSVAIANGGSISASTNGAGNAGTIEVNVAQLTLSGAGAIRNSANSGSSGAAGLVAVTATDRVIISGEGSGGISSALFSETFGSGNGGRIKVVAPTLVSEGNAGIGTRTFAAGNAGEIEVQTGELILTNGAQLNSSARSGSSGSGGNVTATATDQISISGVGRTGPSGLLTDAAGSGAGGNIHVRTGQIRLSNGATISSTSAGSGNAGNITIDAGQSFSSQNGSVTTQASQASGGNIVVAATEMVRLTDSGISTSVFGGPGSAGGGIFIDPRFILLQNSRIVAQATQGAGGTITLVAGTVLADPSSLISASSQSGPQGTVTVQAPIQNLSGAMVPMQQEYMPATTLLSQRCAARVSDGKVSTFVVTLREGLPPEPGGPLPSPLEDLDRAVTQTDRQSLLVAAASGSLPIGLIGHRGSPLTSDETCGR
jgi:large exoprotein involved in heme utilization and adhesion